MDKDFISSQDKHGLSVKTANFEWIISFPLGDNISFFAVSLILRDSQLFYVKKIGKNYRKIQRKTSLNQNTRTIKYVTLQSSL